MNNTRSFGIGSFNDILVVSGHQIYLAYREGDPRVPGRLVVKTWLEKNFADILTVLTIDLPAETPCFPRLHRWAGQTWLAYHDGRDGHLRGLETGQERVFPVVTGGPYFAFTNGYFGYQQGPGFTVHTLDLDTNVDVVSGVGRGTGLSRLTAGGSPVTVDEDRFALRGATIPCFSRDISVGEGPDGGVVWEQLQQIAALRGLLFSGLNCFQPRVSAGETYVAISTHGPDVRVWVGTRAELQQEIGQPSHGDVPPHTDVHSDIPHTDTMHPLPPDNGIVDGVIVNPKHFFLTLVHGKDVRQYRQVLLDIAGKLWGAGFGIQNDSGGTPRGRLFLPHAGCPDASPQTVGEQRLGVRQDIRCWDQQGIAVDVVENDANGNPIGWVWVVRGNVPYVPFTSGTPHTDIPHTDVVPHTDAPPDTGLVSRVAQLEKDKIVLRDAVVELSRLVEELARIVDQKVSKGTEVVVHGEVSFNEARGVLGRGTTKQITLKGTL